jgi:tetratricopeptide (TPR) repeat protein
MLDLKPPHLDDFTLLCYVAGELGEAERSTASDHLAGCRACRRTHSEIIRLDKELSLFAKDPVYRQQWYVEELPAGDPFHRQPFASRKPPRQTAVTTVERLVRVSGAAENAMAASESLLAAVKNPAANLADILSRLSFSELTDRFALLYTLQEAGRQIAEDPRRLMAFADDVIADVKSSAAQQAWQAREAERDVPLRLLRGQAHQLAGQARLWTGELEIAGSHFRNAYQDFALLGDETGVARVEQLEAQRRFFTGHGGEALILARRAATTFALLGLDDEKARARGAEGMALFQLGRWQAAADAFGEALRVFESYQSWSNYVGTLNSIANSLVKMGRLDEARREYAKALRRLSREQHRSWVPFIRKGLAEVLFSAGLYREAAVQASRAVRLYAESGQVSRSLMASLFEAESWARAGDLSRARHRLELFGAEIRQQGILDPTLAGLIEEALSGRSVDFQAIVNLREWTDAALRERFGTQA